MPRNITVTLADGTTHVYANAPDNITPDAVTARAQKDFGQGVKALDGGRSGTPAKASPAPAAAPAASGVKDVAYYRDRWSNLSPAQAKGLLRKFNGAKADARAEALAGIAGLDLKTRPAAAPTRQARAVQAGRAAAADTDPATNFGSAFAAGVRRNMFGIPERLAAAGERFLPSAITGNNSDASYDEILTAARAKTDAEAGRSTGGNILGSLVGGVTAGRGAAGILGSVAGAATSAASPVIARAGNVLQNLMTLQKGRTVANAGKVVLGGAAGGATQAAGEGSNPVAGAAAGAAGAAVLGTGFKAVQVVTRPFRDFTRLSSASRILSRLTNATTDQLQTRADAYRRATGAEPTLFELLPLADRNKILKQAVVGRDNVVEATSEAIRRRAGNLGPEMSERARTILAPQRDTITTGLADDLATARGGVPDPGDAPLARSAARSPTDMLELRDTEARAIMAPHENTPIVGNLDELYPSVPNPSGTGAAIATDPEVAAVIRSAAGVLRQRPDDAGVTAGDITDMISTLRGDIGKGGIEGRTAQRAIDHLQGTLDDIAPDAGDASRRMTDAYAARSRMAEGMKEGAATRLRDDVQVGTNRTQARTVRNAYDSVEGDAGRALGQGNRVLTDLGGSPDEALRTTIGIARGNTSRPLAQNVGNQESQDIVAAARAQDASAQALSSASSMAQSGGGEAATAETLVAALAGLHPASFITTKAGAMRKLMDMTYIPETRARTMINMIFSQDPATTARALRAVGNEGNGSQFLKYLSGVTGMLSANGADVGQGGENSGPSAADDLLDVPGVPTASGDIGEEPEADTGIPASDEDVPVDEGSSPYAANLQQIYDTESPEMLDLIARVSGQESGGQQHDANGQPLTSSAGAIGVMQVMPDTAPEAAQLAGVPFDENAYRNDPAYNKLIGIAYLSELLRRYGGDVAKATAAYNAGSGRVNAALSGGGDWLSRLPAETQDYVQKVA